MEQDNIGTARAFLDALMTESVDTAFARYCCDDVTFWSAGFGEVGHHLAALKQTMDDNVDDDGVTMTIHGVSGGGDRVALETESLARLRNGKIYNNHYHFLILFENRRIKRVKEYHDTAHAAEIWGDLFGAVTA